MISAHPLWRRLRSLSKVELRRTLVPILCPWCAGHGCRHCSKLGLVCPTCRGLRVLGSGRVCRDCCEGNNYSLKREMSTIYRQLSTQGVSL